ncbi:MAG: RsmB/NOP family class I SAM-dependent RNA methyltransferase [Alphaproteobacteria bacterium]|nr:RsmB/NOP family class I SAM-dependent RNA methyltransferase [Alphaproteobacteria bacterium]
MTPAARLQAAIEVLDGLAGTAQPVDRYLRDYFRMRRYAGSKDRAAVAEQVYAVMRHRSSLAWRMGSADPRALVMGAMLAEGVALDTLSGLFDGRQHHALPLTEAERAVIAVPPSGDPPLPVRGEFPPFLEPELMRAFGPALQDEMLALQVRAPIDLRVNTLKAERDAVMTSLRAEGFAVEPTPYSPFGLRLPPGEGSAKLSLSPLFVDGAFEFQDEAAQIAALLCGVKSGIRVLDFAAGAGGKTLALAALMRNQGEIVAHDVDPARLRRLAPRAVRAGATIIRRVGERPKGAFDVVLVDAPCTGTGTWRRQPELRWRIRPERLHSLNTLQDDLLAQGAEHTAVGGRLIYATCSLLPAENEDRVAHLLSRRPDFAALSADEIWRTVTDAPLPPGMLHVFQATPLRTGTDGFFTAVLQRRR